MQAVGNYGGEQVERHERRQEQSEAKAGDASQERSDFDASGGALEAGDELIHRRRQADFRVREQCVQHAERHVVDTGLQSESPANHHGGGKADEGDRRQQGRVPQHRPRDAAQQDVVRLGVAHAFCLDPTSRA